MNPFALAWADLRRARWAALALIALIAVAVAIGVGVSAQERAIRQGGARAANDFDIVIGAPGSQTQLVLTAVYLQEAALPLVPGSVLTRVAAEPGAKYVSPLAFGDSLRGQPIVGVTADFVTRGGRLTLADGRVFASDEEAVIGADVKLALGQKITPTHGASHEKDAAGDGHNHEGVAYEVVGRLPRTGSPWDRAILVPIEAVWEAHALPSGHAAGDEKIGSPWDGENVAGVPAILVKAASVADAYRLRAKYRGDGVMAVFPGEVLVDLYATMGDVRAMMSGLALAAQCLVLVSILIGVLAVLSARRRQIAVLRALGAPRGFVFAVIWLQIAGLVAAGAVLGLGLGVGAAYGLSQLAEARFGVALPLSIGPDEWTTVAIAAGLGMVLAAIPAAIGYRQSIAAALKADL